jgi:NAD(P)H-dependent FMN reductase
MSKIRILGICGSASSKSSNLALLKKFAKTYNERFEWSIINSLRDFPLFRPEDLNDEIPSLIGEFKCQIQDADAILISTPEYTHNIPAVLKNAIEWCTASGEFSEKRILPITFTPAAPRGKYAMHSLIESLKALDAKIVSELSLYKTDFDIVEHQILLSEDIKMILDEAMGLF